jgi:hypothetical protein
MSVLVPSQSLSLVSASYTHERALRATASRLPETKPAMLGFTAL